MKKLFKEHDLAKIVSLTLLVVIALTWIIPNGSYSTGAEFTMGTRERIGLVHIFYGIAYALQNFSLQIVYLAFVGIFYGVASHTDAYKNLVNKVAKFGKKKEIGFAIVVSFLIALLSSVLNNDYIVLTFIPFLIHVLRKMNFNKLGIFISTFGAMFVGILGATYGSEGMLAYLNYLGNYGGAEITVKTLLLARAGILLLTFIIYSVFNIRYLKKHGFDKKLKEVEETDAVYLDQPKNSKAKTWPMVIVLILLLIFAILGFVDWNGSFGLEIFDKFHEWLMNLSIGNFPIFEAILGANLSNMGYDLATAFGTWYLFNYSVVIAILTVFVALFGKFNSNEFFNDAYEGFKKMVRPITYLVLIYTVFVLLYWSPFFPTIVNWLGNMVGGAFNPFIQTIQALIVNLLNSDLGYVGFSLTYYLGNFAGKEGNIVYLIYTTTYGLVSFITPVSMFLLFGLSYLNIPYKKWFKYIWKFLLAMLIILVLIFALMTYI